MVWAWSRCPASIQTASRPNAGSVVGVPRSSPNTLPGLIAISRSDIDLGLAHRHAVQGDAVRVRGQVQVVADVHRLHQEAEFLRQLLAHTLDPVHQLAALLAVDQRDQAVAHLEPDHVDRLHVLPGEFPDLAALIRAGQRLHRLGLGRGRLLALHDHVGQSTDRGTEQTGTPGAACRE